jgi:lipoprotein-anchoring transpeptidase ErfK/SrfK
MSRGQAGQRLDTEAIEAELLSQANALRPKNISLAYVSDPTLDDQATKDELLRKAASRLESPVLLKSGDQEFSFAPEVLAKWLTVQNEDEEWSLALNADVALADLKAQLASLEQKPTPMQTYQALESVDPIQAGEDGRAVDYVATMDRLQKQWLGSGKKSFDVATKVIQRPVEFLSVTAPHAEGKSILTDLSRQTTFAFKDGQLQFFSLASTGKYPMPTPTGEFKIYNKTRRQVMDGPGYYLPNVQWVMFYNGDYSLHGTYWHNNFGHPMSHGCSNLSNASAERFYNFADVGTPVTIIGETPRK